MRIPFQWFVALFMLFSLPVQADERILDFNSEIMINPDGSMIVTETITVRSEQENIRRGIYRDFPTRYRDRQGNAYTVAFEMLSASRDGSAENYFTEKMSNGVRIYLGSKSTVLAPGEYEYRIRYRTDRQLGHFGNRDELYWNVTGNGWGFPIDKASAQVLLPDGVPMNAITTDLYTGAQGSREQHGESLVAGRGLVTFATNQVLPPQHGLTIVVDWPAGFVARPTTQEKLGHFVNDNRNALVLGVGSLLVFLYYFLVWRRVGVDPQGGPVFPHYVPPNNLSPGAMRYIMEMGADDKAFSAAIVSLAVKGRLRIVEDDDDEYRLEKVADKNDSNLSAGERKLVKELFSGRSTVELKNSNHSIINNAKSAWKKALKGEYGRGFFRRNSGYFAVGIIVSLALAIYAAFNAPTEREGAVFLTVWLMPWTAVVTWLLLQKRFLFAAMFGFFEVAAGVAFFSLVGAAHLVLLVLLAVINMVFFHLLKAPTSLGRKLMDAIEGFKLYLGVAEGDELKMATPAATGLASHGAMPPEKTVELFERYLPYAIALDVEQEWAEQFTKVLQAAGQAAGKAAGDAYHPAWYSGHHWNVKSPATFSRSLGGAFAGAISSAGVAPGSGSGGSGGGFSGGGGGGGGGGGW